MRKIFGSLIFLTLTLQCLSQTRSTVDNYKTFSNGKEMHISLYSDSTYNFTTYWGEYHGRWEIIENGEDSLFDKIYFYDFVFDTKDAFYYSHFSLNEDLEGNAKEPFVTMFDLTGDIVPYYSVCFSDSNNDIISCDYNSDTLTRRSIPDSTRLIGMIGESGNLSTYFKCRYSSSDGCVAFIIGPSVGRFYINKERNIIKYQSCHCDDYHKDCSAVFNEVSAIR